MRDTNAADTKVRAVNTILAAVMIWFGHDLHL